MVSDFIVIYNTSKPPSVFLMCGFKTVFGMCSVDTMTETKYLILILEEKGKK